MLRLSGPASGTTCDGVSRRNFLKIGSLGAAGLTLADLNRARASQPPTGSLARDTSVVWLWLGGGPTHVETFDPKPDAPAEFRSATGSVATTIPGVHLGGTFPEMAKLADKMAFVRSFAHKNSGHGGGTHWVMTGYDFVAADNGGTPNKPGYGAILARHRGPNNPSTGLPTYTKLSNILADGPAWLGAPYAPFDVAGRARQNLDLKVPADRLADRRTLLDSFDTLNKDIDRTGLLDGLDGFERQAFDLILGPAKKAFDVSKEPESLRERYGKGGLGEQLLLARRLCEAGVGFVTVNFGGWDMHGQIGKAMQTRGTQLDKAVAAFVADVAARGLDKDILLVITGEFGRTPRINNNGGRDHWAPLTTLALAGGGLKMGQAVGESTSKAETPKSNPIGPQDLMATVFHVLGIPQDLHYKDPSGRPVPMVQGGRPIAELLS